LLFDYIIIISNNNNNFKQDRVLLFYIRTAYNYKIQFYSINIICEKNDFAEVSKNLDRYRSENNFVIDKSK